MDKVFAGKDFQFLSQVDGGAGSAKTFVCQLIIDHANQLAQTKNQPTTGSELRVSREQGALTKLQPRTRSSAEASASTSIYRPGEASMEALVMWTESRRHLDIPLSIYVMSLCNYIRDGLETSPESQQILRRAWNLHPLCASTRLLHEAPPESGQKHSR